mgnify:CR=1 FL=1
MTIRSLFVALALTLTAFSGAIAPVSLVNQAHAARDHYTVPLMVIRFNQPRMYYEKPLFNTIAAALNTKQEAQFKVIHYYPTISERMTRQAKQNYREVLKNISGMGVPRSRIASSEEVANDLSYPEVHIYVY